MQTKFSNNFTKILQNYYTCSYDLLKPHADYIYYRERVGKEHYEKYVELLTYEKVYTGCFSLFKILVQKQDKARVKLLISPQ